MQILPIDVTALVAVVMGMLIVLIPIAGVTARFALKPLVESIGRFMQVQGSEEALKMSERRIALLEQNLDAVEDELRRIRDAQDFDHALRSGDETRSLPAEGSEPAASP
ncbi:MAG TPA: hypothetical protein VJ925_06805 [Longimicrobiales bacterium]|nr:hypothetical protein [Longimicrobiales bacterium]